MRDRPDNLGMSFIEGIVVLAIAFGLIVFLNKLSG